MKMILWNQYTGAKFFFYIIVSWLYKKQICINLGLFKASKIAVNAGLFKNSKRAINLGLFKSSNHRKERIFKDQPSKKQSTNPQL